MAAEAERARQAEAERVKQAEAERARKAAEAERARQAEAERVKQAAEAERAQRAAEARACAEAAAKAEAKESEQAAQAKQPVPVVAVAREELAAPSRSRSRTVMAALLGVGGAAILAGGGFLIGSAVQSDSGARAKLLDDWATHYETAEAMRLAGAITAGVGGALAIGGILAAALPKREPRAGIWIAPAAGGVAAGGRF